MGHPRTDWEKLSLGKRGKQGLVTDGRYACVLTIVSETVRIKIPGVRNKSGWVSQGFPCWDSPDLQSLGGGLVSMYVISAYVYI